MLTLSHQVLLVEVDPHIVLTLEHLEGDNISLLVLVEILGQNIGTLCVSLAPLFSLSVVQLQAKDTLTELVHEGAPEHDIDLTFFPAEKSVNLRELTEEETTSVSSALLIRGRDGTEFTIPGLASLITAFKCLTIDGISEAWTGTISVAVDKLANTVAEKLVACDMHLV